MWIVFLILQTKIEKGDGTVIILTLILESFLKYNNNYNENSIIYLIDTVKWSSVDMTGNLLGQIVLGLNVCGTK